MKKLCFSLIVAILVSWVSLCQAAGLVVVSHTQISIEMWKITYSWTADSVAATIPAKASPSISGIIFLVESTPGAAVAPTDNYTITITKEMTDSNTLDIMGATMTANQSSSAAASYQPTGCGSSYCLVNGPITLNVSGNSVVSATGTVTVYYFRTP
jgi:hypothetical protein